MSRTDKLKMTSDTTCQTTRVVNKNCNKTKQEKNIKDRKDKNKKNQNGEYLGLVESQLAGKSWM